jgi:hypothetical protein
LHGFHDAGELGDDGPPNVRFAPLDD